MNVSFTRKFDAKIVFSDWGSTKIQTGGTIRRISLTLDSVRYFLPLSIDAICV